MKILYGVQGTGNGHIARARIMASALAARSDIDVDFVFTGRAPEKYFDMECFGNYRTFKGLSFISRKGKIDKAQTLRQARPNILRKDIRNFDASQYDLLLNDFEPLTAWAAKKQNIPSISVSHQASFRHASVPRKGESLIDKLILRYFAPTDIQLGVHWYHFNSAILPPFVVDKPVQNPSNAHVLVYLPFEDISDIQQMLEPISEQVFVCFHPAITEPKNVGHIHWHPTSKQNFQHALQHCTGVIGNGGFELSSESIQLGKKLLIKPLHGQFEQISNILVLNKLGLCQNLFQLDTDIVEEWLAEPENEPITYPDDPTPFIDWLLEGNWHNTQTLCDELWQQVKFGNKTRERLLSLAI